jgi:PhnB protein
VAGVVEPRSRTGRQFAVVIYMYVEDVDKTVERAVAGGAKVLFPVSNQFWGDRIGWVMDPAGHVWTVATHIEETTEEERKGRWGIRRIV